MIMVEPEKVLGEDTFEYKTMFCKCGCGNGVVLKAYKDEDFGVGLSLVSDNFYSGQYSLKEKFKRIWYVIRGKEYCYFDILIKPNELAEFKSFVEQI